MLFKSILNSKAKKACTGVGYNGICYVVGRKYYQNGKLAYIY